MKTRVAVSPGTHAWELMYEIFRASKPYLERVAAEFDMTPQQVFVLKSLEDTRAASMSEIATLLGCDASNVTAIVDRLEARGFVERRPSASDRRVKEIVVTEAGGDLRGRIRSRLERPPPAIANLSVADQQVLCEIFTRALAAP